jgi:hypothetical protein
MFLHPLLLNKIYSIPTRSFDSTVTPKFCVLNIFTPFPLQIVIFSLRGELITVQYGTVPIFLIFLKNPIRDKL